MRKTNRAGIELIKKFEGCRLKAYKCPAGVWTIGFGHTVDVKSGQVISQHQADVILESDLELFETALDTLVPPCTSNAFSACVALAFNIGISAFTKSTLIKKFRSGGPYAAAPEFLRWTKAGGKELPGLVKRREAERLLFLTP